MLLSLLKVDLIFSESRDAILSQHYGLTSLEIFDADQNGDSSEYDDGNTMYCSDDGGLVTHKANGDFIKCFNKGLYKIRANGEYKEICCASKYNPFYPTGKYINGIEVERYMKNVLENSKSWKNRNNLVCY